jgi:hypothetical protein
VKNIRPDINPAGIKAGMSQFVHLHDLRDGQKDFRRKAAT